MKNRLYYLWILAAMALTMSCIFSATPLPGSPSAASTPGPTSGLETLTHFRADLTVTTNEQTDSGAVDQTKRYSLSAWPSLNAAFETMDTVNEENQVLTITLGTVGDAGYELVGGDTGCSISWAANNIHIDDNDLLNFLLPVLSSTPAGDETVAGIATHAFSLNSDSIGFQGVQAKGEEWLAVNGNYIVKYHLEMTGGKALFGSDATGTSTIDYALSEVNDGSAVKYPGDCLPVLTDVPTTQDAQDMLRMPGSLSFSSATSPADIQKFYLQYFSGQGWKQISNLAFSDGETDTSYFLSSTGESAIVSVRADGKTAQVKVDAFAGQPAASSASGTPSPNPGVDILTRISLASSKALGSANTPSVYPSYALSMNETVPTASGSNSTSLEAEVQNADMHYVLTTNGKKSEVLRFGGQVYAITDGKAQPGSALTDLGWTTWQMDLAIIYGTAAMANPQPQASDTLESRMADKYAIDSSSLQGGLTDFGMGLLPYTITAIQGTIWIDHETGGLLKADLTFDADVKKPGETKPTGHGEGELHILFHQIGEVTVSPPQ